MSQSNNKELEMAVGTSNMLESNMMETDNFYTPMETATEPESATQSQWTGVKNDTGQLCRVCANSSDYAVPIYEGEGLEHQLEFKIQKHLPIHVSITDMLPLQLCYQCASTLIAYDSMLSNCLDAEKKLKAMQEAAEEAAEEASKTNEEYDDSQLDTAPAADSDDEPLIQSKTKLLSEKTKATPIKKKILSKAKTRSVTVKTDKTATNSKEGEDKERCREWRRPRENIQNVEVLISLPIQTEIKEEPPEDEDGGRVKTEDDQKIFVDNYDERKRTKKKKKGLRKTGRFYCDQCEKVCSTEKNLERHLRTHEKKKSFICHLCGKEFKHNYALQRHVRTVHENRRDYVCDLCGKAFLEKSVRDDHRRIHTGECPYVCHTCGKAFKTMASLCIHRKIHTDSFPHECTFCPKRFRFKQQLLGHLTMHTGEKKHFCDICGKGFGVRWDLTRHRPIHNTSKDFVCTLCGMSFTCKKYVQRHSKSHQKDSRMGKALQSSLPMPILDLALPVSVPVPLPISTINIMSNQTDNNVCLQSSIT